MPSRRMEKLAPSKGEQRRGRGAFEGGEGIQALLVGDVFCQTPEKFRDLSCFNKNCTAWVTEDSTK